MGTSTKLQMYSSISFSSIQFIHSFIHSISLISIISLVLVLKSNMATPTKISINIVVSKKKHGTPKSSFLIGVSLKTHPDIDNIQIISVYNYMYIYICIIVYIYICIIVYRQIDRQIDRQTHYIQYLHSPPYLPPPCCFGTIGTCPGLRQVLLMVVLAVMYRDVVGLGNSQKRGWFEWENHL